MVLPLLRLPVKLSQSNILCLSPPEECSPLGSTWSWPLHQSMLSFTTELHVLRVPCDAFIIPLAFIFLDYSLCIFFRHHWFCVTACTISIQGKRKEVFNNLILILTDLIHLKLSLRSFTLYWDWVKNSFFCKIFQAWTLCYSQTNNNFFSYPYIKMFRTFFFPVSYFA